MNLSGRKMPIEMNRPRKATITTRAFDASPRRPTRAMPLQSVPDLYRGVADAEARSLGQERSRVPLK